MKTIIFALLIAASLTGCAGMTHFDVAVSSFAKPDVITKGSFVIAPGQEGISEDDFQFQEFAGYLEKVLLSQGFSKREPGKPVDLMIFLSYRIGDPKTIQNTVSVPTYGQTGVASATTYGNVTTFQPSYGVTGVSSEIVNSTTFQRNVTVSAYLLGPPGKEPFQIWRAGIASIGSSGDLRLVFPYMAVAAGPYFGKNSGQAVSIDISMNDPRVAAIKLPPVR